MNDLQVALIAVGAAAVAGVWGYNKWQERTQRILAEKVFRGDQADALFSGKAHGESVDTHKSDVRTEPVLADVQAEEAVEEERSFPPLPEQWTDEVADCVVRIDFAEAVPAPSLWAAQSFLAPHVSKCLSWLAFDTDSWQWHRLSSDDTGRYALVCASLQLADRRGSVSDTELSVFLDGIRQLAQQFAGVADVPAHEAVLMHAKALDDFCAGVDVQLGVNVVAVDGNAFSGAKLNELALAAGLSLHEDGFFHACNDTGLTLFTLGNHGAESFNAASMDSLATNGVTLSLDVPKVVDGASAFDRLLVVAQQLTEGLGGLLVDGQGNPLSGEMIESIRAKVAELQGKMTLRQITAGSPRALRLFS
jgi:FtsZ-interacting cell division protein ZipA